MAEDSKEQQVTPWPEIASKLDPMMPKAQFDSMRQDYFRTFIAPHVNFAHHDKVRQEFMSRTERAPLIDNVVAKTVLPVGLVGTALMESLTSPLEAPAVANVFNKALTVAGPVGMAASAAGWKPDFGKETHQRWKRQQEELVKVAERDGLPSTPNIVAGQLVGMGVPIGGLTSLAGKVAPPLLKMALNSERAIALASKVASGGAAFAAYNAASDEHGNRWLAGAEGAAWGVGGELAFGLLPFMKAKGVAKTAEEALERMQEIATGVPTTATEDLKDATKIVQAMQSPEVRMRPATIMKQHVELEGGRDVAKDSVLFVFEQNGKEFPHYLRAESSKTLRQLTEVYGKQGAVLKSINYTDKTARAAHELLAGMGQDMELKYAPGARVVAVDPKKAEEIADQLLKEGTAAKVVGPGKLAVREPEEAFVPLSEQDYWGNVEQHLKNPVYHQEEGVLWKFDGRHFFAKDYGMPDSLKARLPKMDGPTKMMVERLWDPKIDELTKGDTINSFHRYGKPQAWIDEVVPKRFRSDYSGSIPVKQMNVEKMPAVESIVEKLQSFETEALEKTRLEQSYDRFRIQRHSPFEAKGREMRALLDNIKDLYSPFTTEAQKQEIAEYVGSISRDLVPERFQANIVEEAVGYRAYLRAVGYGHPNLDYLKINYGSEPITRVADKETQEAIADIFKEAQKGVSDKALAADVIGRGVPLSETSSKFEVMPNQGTATQQLLNHEKARATFRVRGTKSTAIVEPGAFQKMGLSRTTKGITFTHGERVLSTGMYPAREAGQRLVEGEMKEFLNRPVVEIERGGGKEVIYHESLHADMFGVGIYDKSMPKYLDTDIRTAAEIGSGMMKAGMYKGEPLTKILEEVYVHSATALRNGDFAKLQFFAKLDKDIDSVLKMIESTSSRLERYAKSLPDSAQTRILERKMADLIDRSSSTPMKRLAKIANDRDAAVYFDHQTKKWTWNDGEKVKSFDTLNKLHDHLYNQSAADLMLPSVTGRIEEMGIRPSEYQELPRMQGRLPSPDVGLDESVKSRGVYAITGWFRPIQNWMESLQGKMNQVMGRQAIDVAGPFAKMHDMARKGLDWQFNVTDRLGKILGGKTGKLNEYTELLGTPEGQWPDLARQLKLDEKDLQAVRDFKQWAREFKVDTSLKGTTTPEQYTAQLKARTPQAEQIEAARRMRVKYEETKEEVRKIREDISRNPGPHNAPLESKIDTLLSQMRQYKTLGDVGSAEGFAQATKQEGVDLNQYLEEILPKLKRSNFEPEIVFPNTYDSKSAGFWERMLKDPTSSFDPTTTHLGDLAMWAVRQGYEQKFTGDAIKELEKALATKTQGGKLVVPAFLQAPIRRNIAYMKGIPDFTQQILNNSVKGLQGAMSKEFQRINKYLPFGAKLPTQFDAPQHVINRLMVFSYAFGLGARPAIVVRDTFTAFLTTLPISGPKRFTYGLSKALTREGWRQAKEAGAFLHEGTLGEMYGDFISEIPHGGKGLSQRLIQFSNMLLSPSRWGNNFCRAVTYHAEFENNLKLFEQYRNGQTLGLLKDRLEKTASQVERGQLQTKIANLEKQGIIDEGKLFKDTSLWFEEKSARTRMLQSLKDSTEKTEDLAKRAALDTIDSTHWAYRKGLQPALLQSGAGRIFGQYGIWPANFLDFLGKMTKRSFEYPDKALQMWGSFLAVNTAAYEAMSSIGADASKWLYLSPAGYGTSPHFQLVQDLRVAPEESQEGYAARKRIMEYPLNFVPSMLEIENILKAFDQNASMFDSRGFPHMTPQMARVMGFRAMPEMQEDLDWKEWIKKEAGFSSRGVR